MLQKLSYINLFLAIIYVLFYFKTINFNSVGLFSIIVFNWLALSAAQHETYKWLFWHYLFGLWTIYYAGYTIYGCYHILVTSFEYGFISSDIKFYLILSITFSLTIALQFAVYATKAFNKKSAHQ